MQSTSKLRRLLSQLGLSIASLLVFGLLLEFVVFRYVFVAPSIPRVAFSDGVLKYRPNQRNPSRDPEPPYRYNAGLELGSRALHTRASGGITPHRGDR